MSIFQMDILLCYTKWSTFLLRMSMKIHWHFCRKQFDGLSGIWILIFLLWIKRSYQAEPSAFSSICYCIKILYTKLLYIFSKYVKITFKISENMWYSFFYILSKVLFENYSFYQNNKIIVKANCLFNKHHWHPIAYLQSIDFS